MEVHLTDTYFVVAHARDIMVGGIHFWWPRISGRRCPEALGIFAALLAERRAHHAGI